MSSFTRRIERQVRPSRAVHPVLDLDGKPTGKLESYPPRAKFFGGRGSVRRDGRHRQHTPAALDMARNLLIEEGKGEVLTSSRAFDAALIVTARLLVETGRVPSVPSPFEVLEAAMDKALPSWCHDLDSKDITKTLLAELAKRGVTVVKVATDGERLIEAQELCAKVAEGLGHPKSANEYREGTFNDFRDMIAMVDALRARDGAA